jgi:[protein-PII] uridylyltransferase
VRAFLRRLPLAVDPEHFLRFALGFPHRYLANTSPVEIVRHYGLMEGLGKRGVITSLAREGARWRLCLVSRDRSFLFSRIAGSLLAFGMNIESAEAFANANALVLDTFHFSDRGERFADDGERRRFQAFLEDVVEAKTDLAAALGETANGKAGEGDTTLILSWDDGAHPTASRLIVEGRDRLGLLYSLSHRISEAGYAIEMAYIETPGERVRDEFYLAGPGGKLTEEEQAALGRRLARSGGMGA